MARAVARPPMPPPTIAILMGPSSRSKARSCAIFVAGAMSGLPATGDARSHEIADPNAEDGSSEVWLIAPHQSFVRLWRRPRRSLLAHCCRRCLRPIRPTFDGTAKRSRISRVWLHRKVADEPQLVPRGSLDRLG